jgi:hypothetical protein
MVPIGRGGGKKAIRPKSGLDDGEISRNQLLAPACPWW